LDSKEPTENLNEFIMGEVRYSTLVKQFPQEAQRLHTKLAAEYVERYRQYKLMAEGGLGSN